MSEGDSVAKSVSMTSDHDEEAGDDEPVILQRHAADHGDERQHLADAAGGAASGSEAVLAGKAAADEAAHVQRVGRDEVHQRQSHIHPDQAAQKMGGGDEGLVEKMNVAACACECGGQHQRRGQVGQRPGEGEDELGASLAGAFLALRVGVGEEAADGQQQHGAQTQAEPGRGDEAGGLADQDRGNKNEKQHEAAAHSVFGAERKTDQGEQGEEGVDAQLDAHPAAQRD